MELFPAESRLVDTANHYHLWVFPEHRFPFGMAEREVTDGGTGISQRPHRRRAPEPSAFRQRFVFWYPVFNGRLTEHQP